MLFGKRLNEIRKSKGFTAKHMAIVAGVNLHSYRKYERDTRQPSYEILIRIADALNVSTDYLLCRDEYLASTGESVDES
jgi:transcriptional regulator with XRE-family HTH domain